LRRSRYDDRCGAAATPRCAAAFIPAWEVPAISATFSLLNLLGGVALVLWGTYMVQMGMSRAYGVELRRWIGAALRNPFASMFAGLGATVLLQSSTATALLLTTFASQGIIGPAPGLAVMLGADVGTTLVAQLLTLDLSWLAPLLLVMGVALHRRSHISERQEVGRVLIGLGITLFALRHIVATVQPLRDGGVLQALLPTLRDDLLLQMLIGGLVAWLAHSSLASVLLVISLGHAGAVEPRVALGLVLGINVGGVFPAVAATLGQPNAARRLPLGNLFFKLAGAAAAVPFLGEITRHLPLFGADPARQIANFHTAFNVALAVVFLFLTPAVARLMRRVLPDLPASREPGAVQYLDPEAARLPGVAIALAEQETLRMADLVETMLRRTLDVLRDDDTHLRQEVEHMDDAVDKLNEAIKLYLTRVSRESMADKDGRRSIEIITFATNLEHMGDIIDKNLMELATKKTRKGVTFSAEGGADIAMLHDHVMRHFVLAKAVFTGRNVDMARRLHDAKTEFRNLERQCAERHLDRLRGGKLESIESSAIHLDILRDLKRLDSHIVSVVYPILEEAGLLRASRLREKA
jgi:phosphate:Na+ symporter